jgi:hypothetical protein
MTGNIALNIAIGLIFIYTLFSLLTTTVVEFIAVNLQLRAKNLKLAVKRMLDDSDKKVVFSEKFNNTPVVKYMSSWKFSIFLRRIRYPSYMRADTFSQAMLYMLSEDATKEKPLSDKIKETLNKYENTETGKYLLFLLDESNNDIEKYKKSLETWFDSTMERSTGWYKKNLTYLTLGFGLFIATVFNIDTFQMIRKLTADPNAREQYVQMAGQLLNNKAFTSLVPVYDSIQHCVVLKDTLLSKYTRKEKTEFSKMFRDTVSSKIIEAQNKLFQRMDSLYQKSENPQSILSFNRKAWLYWFFDSWENFLGCLVTAIAISLGAPFWFDSLNKLMRLRGSVSIPASTEKTKNDSGEK